MKKHIIVFLGAINFFVAIYAQGEIDLQQTNFFNEWSVALMINSNGFGGNYRFGERINAFDKRLYEMDFAYLKDHKEAKSVSETQAKFVDGKKNLAFDFRFGYGKLHEKYRKHDAGGVAIRHFYNFGPSIVLLKPIYYEIKENDIDLPPSKYNSGWSNEKIQGRSSFFKGFDEIRIVPGAFAKFGYNCEFGKEDKKIHAFEAGLIAEGFIKKIEIMDFTNPNINQTKVAKNQQFFITLFLIYRYGKIFDPYEVKKKRERSREISY